MDQQNMDQTASGPDTSAAVVSDEAAVGLIEGRELPTAPVPTHDAHHDGAAADDRMDFDDLEDGIASIFAALHAADAEDAAAEGAGSEDESRPEPDDSLTFALLGELDRLWQRPSP